MRGCGCAGTGGEHIRLNVSIMKGSICGLR